MLKAIHETLEYMFFPDEHWRHIKTNNPPERVVREIHRRTRVVGSFPDGNAALMLVAARLRHIAGIRATVTLYSSSSHPAIVSNVRSGASSCTMWPAPGNSR